MLVCVTHAFKSNSKHVCRLHGYTPASLFFNEKDCLVCIIFCFVFAVVDSSLYNFIIIVLEVSKLWLQSDSLTFESPYSPTL